MEQLAEQMGREVWVMGGECQGGNQCDCGFKACFVS